jgi:hypothetical protein
MNNIFVLCTGRCGSMTMAEACKHATNYTAAHESPLLRYGLVYPDNHIEVNNRLTWFMGLLDKLYPAARYVHLTRDPDAVAISHAKHCARQPARIIEAWRNSLRMGWLKKQGHSERGILTDCREYVEAVTTLIDVFLRAPMQNGKPREFINIDINTPADFARFWDWADCEGDFKAAMTAFITPHNVGKDRASRAKTQRRKAATIAEDVSTHKAPKVKQQPVPKRTTVIAKASKAVKLVTVGKVRQRKLKALQRDAEIARKKLPRGKYGPQKRKV